MQLKIQLERIVCYAYHGVLEQERKVGNTFIIELELSLNNYNSLDSDNLNDTINYAEVYELVASEMQKPSQLLEHIVGRICKSLFKEFDMIEAIDITLKKSKAPFSSDVQSAGVSLSISRQEV